MHRILRRVPLIAALAKLLVAALIYRTLTWRDLLDGVQEATRTSAMLLMIIAGAAIYGYMLTKLQIPQELTQLVADLGLGRTGFLVAMMVLLFLLGLVLGYFYPDIWLSDVRGRRAKAVQRTLPSYLDFITMAVEAGLNMTGAISQAMDKGPPGPLKHEFYMVVRDLRSGLPRADALRRMEARLQMVEISSFVGTVIQAEKMGASLGAALRGQAEQRRVERFQRAEKLAMEAPVKLIGPLMMFIFPVTFIVLGFPIVMKFLNSGVV